MLKAPAKSGLKFVLEKGEWDQLLTAMLARPGDVGNAIRATGLPNATVKRAWERGYPGLGTVYGDRPMRELVTEQIEAARSARVRAEIEAELRAEEHRRNAKTTAIDDAQRVLQEEAQLTKVARALTGQLMRQGVSLLQAADPLVERIKLFLTEWAVQPGDAEKMKPAERAVYARNTVKLLHDLARYVAEVSDLNEAVMRQERLRLGRPDVVVGLAHPDRSPEEAEAEAQALLRLALFQGRAPSPTEAQALLARIHPTPPPHFDA